MKKLLLCLTLLMLTSINAQGVYYGAGLKLGDAVALVSFQAGGEVAPDLEVRAVYDTLLFINQLGADVLYTPATEEVKFYVGPGVLFGLDGVGNGWVGARASVGLELRQNPIGIFGELQPVITTNAERNGFRFRFGINFYPNLLAETPAHKSSLIKEKP